MVEVPSVQAGVFPPASGRVPPPTPPCVPADPLVAPAAPPLPPTATWPAIPPEASLPAAPPFPDAAWPDVPPEGPLPAPPPEAPAAPVAPAGGLLVEQATSAKNAANVSFCAAPRRIPQRGYHPLVCGRRSNSA